MIVVASVVGGVATTTAGSVLILQEWQRQLGMAREGDALVVVVAQVEGPGTRERASHN